MPHTVHPLPAEPHASFPPADAIFVVGLSRSGTTLLRNILNRHSQIAIAPENHFLGHLIASEGVRPSLRRFGDLRDDDRLRAMVDFLYDGGLGRATALREPSRFWTWLTKRMPRAELLRRLDPTDRSERAIFATLLDAFAERAGKSIRGEKTPAHLRHVPLLAEWFPNGRVVHMMRDPRAIFVSEVRRRRAAGGGFPYSLLRHVPPLLSAFALVETTAVSAEGAWRARAVSARVSDPLPDAPLRGPGRCAGEQLQALCAWLGVGFEPAMLEQRVVSVGARLGEVGIDADAATRWRSTIPGWADRWFRLTLGRRMRALGYAEEPR